ncbi:hypothetical protein HYW82_01320 [Candidatus Peregrinibacteria bacterium]|nr:hypothetical protein [Candidatus Peregrinibacteria bacterium]
MTKICAASGRQFEIYDRDLEFYKKISVPEPTMCPEERARRRMAVRNERNLYKRKSDMSGEQIISMYHSDLPYAVYSKEEWLSDKWDAMDHGIDIDFNKPFFGQFETLQKTVPRAAMAIFHNVENCNYCNYVGDAKNSYLCFGSIFIEDCMYGNPYHSKDCVDCFLVRYSEFCYECVDCERLYHCAYLQDCHECSDCFFCYDMKGCRNCVGCVGLRNKSYYIFNKEYSKADYEKFVKDFSMCDPAKVAFVNGKLAELKMAHPRLAMIANKVENVSGNYIFNSKNCFECFQISNNEDCSYNIQTLDNKDCYDMNYTEENELCYEYLGNYRNYKAVFSLICYGCSEVWYCDYCTNCKNCFGCAGLRNKEYCIFNKQYSKEEYEETKERLVKMMKETGEFGEFFPIKISPFAYNESVAHDYFPLSKEEVLARGYRWREQDAAEFKPGNFVPPEDIDKTDESICEKILACEVSGRNYKIMPAEWKFYKRMKVPVPRKHFIERHKARLAKRLPYEIHLRKCDMCGADIRTAYDSKGGEMLLAPLATALRVYCEKCYLDVIY